MIKNVRVLNKTPYYDMKREALFTVGKKPRKDDSYNYEWVKKSIISRHTHIRVVFIEIEFETTKAIRDQLLRSTSGFVEKYVESARPDRTGKPRDPIALSRYIMVFNIEGLIKMSADRLCTQTEQNTRLEIMGLKKALIESNSLILRTVGNMLAPKCCWYGQCNEFRPKDCFGMSWESNKKIEERIEIFTRGITE